MIHAFGQPDAALRRLLDALAARGHAFSAAGHDAVREDSTLVLGGGETLDVMALGVLLGAWRSAPGARVLVVSRLGAHPDARARRLSELWNLEEYARASGMPVLTLRLAPMLGPASPLWHHLRTAPRVPNAGRQLLNPVDESDVVETLDRALSGRARWDGWYEVAGIETLSLAELIALAVRGGPPAPAAATHWEPALEELAEHRMADPRPWLEHFGLAVEPISTRMAGWSTPPAAAVVRA